MKKPHSFVAFASFVSMLCVVGAQAQAYPAKAVRLVVPFSPGGGSDIAGRMIAQKLNELWGQPVIIDNRPGANTVIGTDAVAKSAPDGYTLLVTPAPFAIVPSVVTRLPYDPARDFEPVVLVTTSPLVLLVHPSVPARSPQELAALAKGRPGMLNFGSSGTAGSTHLAAELFNVMYGVKTTHIPYKGISLAMTDLVGGHIDIVYTGIPSALPFIRTGRLRALAVTSLARSGALPEMPTLDELGLKGFRAEATNGLTAPARTPREVINKISTDVTKIVKSPALIEQLKAEGADPGGGTPEQYAAFLRDETVKWAKVLKAANVKKLD
jgi:tripartite-type tricarboxylate transporter receptor subunit TctC